MIAQICPEFFVRPRGRNHGPPLAPPFMRQLCIAASAVSWKATVRPSQRRAVCPVNGDSAGQPQIVTPHRRCGLPHTTSLPPTALTSLRPLRFLNAMIAWSWRNDSFSTQPVNAQAFLPTHLPSGARPRW